VAGAARRYQGARRAISGSVATGRALMPVNVGSGTPPRP
jgi:hypothetical protein